MSRIDSTNYQLNMDILYNAIITTYGDFYNYGCQKYKKKSPKDILEALRYDPPQIRCEYLHNRYGSNSAIKLCRNEFWHMTKMNIGPSNTNGGDCSIESFMLVTGKTWKQVYREMVEAGMYNTKLFNHPYSLVTLLNRYGFKFVTSNKVNIREAEVDTADWKFMYPNTSVYTVIHENIDKELYILVPGHAIYYNNRVLYDIARTPENTEVFWYAYRENEKEESEVIYL